MNPMYARHTVKVQRSTRAIVAGQVSQGSAGTVVETLRCLVEPLSSKQQETILGRLARARYRITWWAVTQDVREGDVVEFVAGPGLPVGRRCWLREITADTMRMSGAYCTGILEEGAV